MRPSRILGLALSLGACKGEETDTDTVDTEAPALAITSFVMSPQGVAAGSPITASFSVTGAATCEVAFNGTVADRTLTAGEVASGSFALTLDAPAVDALIAASQYNVASALFAALTCTGDTGADTAYAAVEVVRAPDLAITADPTWLPSTGGDLTLCWTSTEGTCRVSTNDGAELGTNLAMTGCLEPFEPAGSDRYFVECCGDSSCENTFVDVARGPAITTFAVAPRVLPAPGALTTTWESREITSCTLRYDDGVVATGTSGTASIDARAGTSVVFLECLDATGANHTVSTDVVVGTSIARFDLLQLNPGEVFAQWTSANADSCSLELRSGATTRTFSGLPAVSPHQRDWWDDFVPFNFADPDDVVNATLTCNGLVGMDDQIAGLAERTPAGLVDAWVTPATAPTAGGTVDLCWEARNTEICRLYNDDDWVDVAEAGCAELTVGPDEYRMRQLFCVAGESQLSHEFWSHAGPSNEIHAEPRFLEEADTTTLTWTSVEMTDCTVEDPDGVPLSTDLSGDLTVAVTEDTAYSVTCTGPEGPVTETVNVLVGPGIDAFVVNPTRTLDRLELQWTTHGMEACEVELDNLHDQFVLDDVAPYSAWGAGLHASYATLRLHTLLDGAGDSTVTLRCEGPKGTGLRTIVVPEPELVTLEVFEVTPTDLPAGGGLVDICWEATGADGCTVGTTGTEEPWEEIRYTAGAKGCVSDDDVNGAGTFVAGPALAWLDCSSAIDVVHAEQQIAVGPTIRSFEAVPAVLPAAGTVTFAWDAVQVTTCELRDADGVVATGLTNAGVDVPVDATTSFTLECIGTDATAVEERIVVGVGPDVMELWAEAAPGKGKGAYVQVGMQSTPFVDDCSLYLDAEDGTRTSPFGVYAGGFPDFVVNSVPWDFGANGAATVTLLCHAGSNVIRRSVVVPVPSGPLRPLVTSFTVTPELSPSGPATVQACWVATEALSCDVVSWSSGSFTGLGASGCQDFTLSDDDFLQVDCSNDEGHRVVGKWARVAPAVVSFVATPRQVFLDEGSTTTLGWESSQVVSCDLILPDGSPVAVSADGTYVATFDTAGTHTFGLSCVDSASGTHWSDVAVDVFSER